MAPKKKQKTEDQKSDPPNKKFRNFVFTLNNYTDECIEIVKKFFLTYCTYAVFGKEVGESGTPHLQGYVELKGQFTLSSIRKKMPTKIANIMPRFSDFPKEAAGYCKKGESNKEESESWEKYFESPGNKYDGFEYGKISNPGTRTDLVEAVEVIKSGEKSVRELRNENPILYHQYGRTLLDIEHDVKRSQFRLGEMTECVWIHGKPGRGKSHAAFMDECESVGGYHPDKVYDWDLEQEFQCGYEGQEVVIINEYKGPHQIKYGVLLKLIDKWPMKIKRKNPLAAMDFISKKVIITSVFHPTEIEWNLSAKDDLDQLLDRIKVKEIKGENKRKETDNHKSQAAMDISIANNTMPGH